jgi:phosphoglycolate phosphatase-like HAD superfamily hydrolase
MDQQQSRLINFGPRHDFFIGFDSDGCIFDTMEIKQKECFCPNTVKHWGLQPVAKYAREASEFVNLYSRWRGINRFPALIRVLDLLTERVEIQARGFQVPQAKGLRDWVASGAPLNNRSLESAAAQTRDPVLQNTLAWNRAVNQSIQEMVHGIPPFPLVRASLEKLVSKADVMCISQTPIEALCREWNEHNLAQYTALIAGQEMGTKQEHLQLAAVGKYPPNHILMVGDAQGDLDAAHACGVLFYPIIPGHEEASWQRLHESVLAQFLDGCYGRDAEARMIREFQTYLPETPPWINDARSNANRAYDSVAGGEPTRENEAKGVKR